MKDRQHAARPYDVRFPLLPAEQLARRLGISVLDVYAGAHNGTLVAFRINGVLRIALPPESFGLDIEPSDSTFDLDQLSASLAITLDESKRLASTSGFPREPGPAFAVRSSDLVGWLDGRRRR